jgi:hypothetical protein
MVLLSTKAFQDGGMDWVSWGWRLQGASHAFGFLHCAWRLSRVYVFWQGSCCKPGLGFLTEDVAM